MSEEMDFKHQLAIIVEDRDWQKKKLQSKIIDADGNLKFRIEEKIVGDEIIIELIKQYAQGKITLEK